MKQCLRHAPGWFCVLLLAASACSNPFQGGSTGQPSASPTAPLPSATPTPLPSASPTPEAAMTPDAQLVQIRMIDRQAGWAWAVDPAAHSWLLHTGDGGGSWAIVTPRIPATYDPSEDLSFFLDSQSAWLLLRGSSAGSSVFVRTRDGGSTWTSLPLQFAFDRFEFRTANEGWAQSLETRAGSWFVRLFRTTDGGLTWTDVSLPPPETYGITSADPALFEGCNTCGDSLYYDPARAILFYSDRYTEPANAVRFSITLDQGKSWHDIELGLPEPEPPGGQVYALRPAFVDGRNGFLSIRITNQAFPSEDPYDIFAIYATQDGGLSWALGSVIDNPEHDSGQEIRFFSKSDGFADCAGFLCATHDGAKTWQPVASEAQFFSTEAARPVYQPNFVDAQVGWVLSGFMENTRIETMLWTTGDGGLTWTQLPFSQVAPQQRTISLDQLDMLDPSNGWAWSFGSGRAVLYRTSDGGRTWADVSPQEVEFTWNGSFFLDAQHAWIAASYPARGESGFLRSSDGGQTWEVFPPTGVASPHFHFVNPLDGWQEVFDESSDELVYSVYETHDAGASWSQVMLHAPLSAPLASTRPGTLKLCKPCGDIAYYDPSRLVLLYGNLQTQPGQPVGILLSVDAGDTWEAFSLTLPPVQAADGIAVADSLVFFDALNGLVPVRITNQDSPNPYSVLAIYATSDGGETWTRRPAVLDDVDFTDPVRLIGIADAFAVCGDDLCVTHDATESWQHLVAAWSFSPDSPSEHALQWDFVDATAGWAISGTGPSGTTLLWTTEDGGRSWTVLNPMLAP